MVVILGATGYIGQAFATELRRRSVPFVPLSRATLDYTRFDVLFHYVRNTRPCLVINAAGFTGRPTFLSCETARADTIQANTLLPQTIARVCYLTKTPMGHVSSGNIFAGAKVARDGQLRIESDLSSAEIQQSFRNEPECFSGFTESDEPNYSFSAPTNNFYSGSKALAEEGLRWFEQVYLWRPGFVFDEMDHPRNLLSQVRSHAPTQHLCGSLSHRGDFVSACLDLWEKNASFGKYHIGNPGLVGHAQIIEKASRIPQSAARMESPEHLTAAHSVKGVHGSGCVLNFSKLQSVGIRLRPVFEALENAVGNWRNTPRPATTTQLQ